MALSNQNKKFALRNYARLGVRVSREPRPNKSFLGRDAICAAVALRSASIYIIL